MTKDVADNMSKMKPDDVPESWLRNKMTEKPWDKVWKSHGFKCLARVNETAGGGFVFPVGYVGVPKEHPDYGKFHDDVDVEAPGGLTFSEPWETENDGLWYFGFDCGHGWDFTEYEEDPRKALEFAYTAMSGRRLPKMISNKSLDYTIIETNKLAKQLAERWEKKEDVKD